MNYYNLDRNSELQNGLEAIVRAWNSGAVSIDFAGKTIKQSVSRKGTEYFLLDAGLPMQVMVYKSQSGGGHMVMMGTSLRRTLDMGVAGTSIVSLRIRGHAKFDSNRVPNIFFFDPVAEGERRGRLMAKLDLVERGLVEAKDAFTPDELSEGQKARVFTQDKAEELMACLKATR